MLRLPSLVLTLAMVAGCTAVDSIRDNLPNLPGTGIPGSGPMPGGAEPGSGNADADSPGEGVWSNYDFVAGHRVLFAHDFEGSRTGDFPSRLDYIAGTLDVVRLGDNQVLRIGDESNQQGGSGCFTITLPETLPEQATIEFRVRTSDPQRRARLQLFSDGSDDTPDPRCTYPPNPHVFIDKDERGLQLPGGYGAPKSSANRGFPTNEWLDVRISMDGDYWKMYVNEERVSNAPSFDFPRARKLHVFMGVYRHSMFLDDIRIAEGGPNNLPDGFGPDGLIETTAIRFDTASDRLRPESTGILNEIVALLQRESGVRVRIEGHTDSDGTDATNQDLSERRADAVRQYLTSKGIASARLEIQGFGESRPVASNDTAEGKAQNRRVGFRRL
jgi:outer membrane protein OmpA-like peptidoglycan-associated protein